MLCNIHVESRKKHGLFRHSYPPSIVSVIPSAYVAAARDVIKLRIRHLTNELANFVGGEIIS